MILRLTVFGTILLLLSSCVSSKKYKQLEMENGDMSTRIQRLEIARERGELAARDLKQCMDNLTTTQTLLNNTNTKYNGLQESYNELEKNYEEILLQNAELLQVTSEEKKNLTDEINKQKEALADQEAILAERQAKIQESEDKINDLTERLNAEQLRMDSLQSNISNALFVFGPSDLSVEQKDGKIYVSLSQKLLFSKGSDVIDAQGRNAIQKLAEVLKDRTDLDIVVEGHTDSDGAPNTNWDLSTRRATSVVKLLQNTGVDPSSLTAAGRAFYDPVAENDTEANKSKNRRTEIILSPKLDEIMNIFRSK